MGAFEFVPGHALEGQSVVILAAHLMTASRDNASKARNSLCWLSCLCCLLVVVHVEWGFKYLGRPC
eukprot:m.147021 g.147021  ORF g.147021 m.147021 type:complete len:66 (-) comp17273_c1_seq4:86-283(-)